jgi:hypothetical protein
MFKTLLVAGVLAALPVIGFAQDSNDPHIGVTEDGASPLPVSQDLGDVQPDTRACTLGGGDCSFIFYNDTSGIIDAFTFDTSFVPTGSFSPPTSAEDPTEYTCSNPNGYGYFLSCSATLTEVNGVDYLDYSFYGVDPTSLGNPYANGNPTGNPEGIAPGDVFYVTLDGWTNGFQNLTLTNTFSVPEASSVLILLTELLLLAGVVALFGRRLRWTRRFDL